MKRSDSRKPNRWPGYNYSMPGWYFVTVCVKDFRCMLGTVIDREMRLNRLGIIVSETFKGIPNYYENVNLDEWIVMPNHLHGIIIVGNVGTAHDNISKNRYGLLSKVIKSFKEASVKKAKKMNIKFSWQRSFYDHVIGFNGYELQYIQEYIKNNPAKWKFDRNKESVW